VATTTIQVTRGLRRKLASLKLHSRESYSEVLERLLEDLRELDEETRREIEQARREIKAGKFKTQEQVRAELGL